MINAVTQKQIIALLLETASRVNVKQKTRKLEIQLENKLRRLFAQHGNAYIKQLDKHKNEFSEALSDDTIDKLFDNSSVTDRMASSVQSATENALSVGADTLIEQLNVDVVFDLENPRAVDFLDGYGADHVSQIDETSKQLLRDVLTNATEQGFSYKRVSQLISKLFADWATKRARLIAITEIGNAYQEGNLIIGKDLSGAGVRIEKSWLTRNDDAVDPHCKDNQDQGWIDVNDLFASGVERPLDHPRCRCVMLIRRKSSE